MTDPKIITALVAARDLISDKQRWTRFVNARDEHGSPCSPLAARACQFCSVGALMRAADGHLTSHKRREAGNFLRFGAKEFEKNHHVFLRSNSASSINDNYGHEAVLQMYDKAIQIAEGEAR